MCIENKACCNLEGMDAGAVLHESRFEDGVRVTCYSGLVPFAVYGLWM